MIHLLPYAVVVWLFLVSLYGIVTSRNLIHMIVCLSVTQSATYVLLLSVGYRSGGTVPIFSEQLHSPLVDPIVQALVLTDIVVGATVTALLLALAVQLHKRTGSLDPWDMRAMRG